MVVADGKRTLRSSCSTKIGASLCVCGVVVGGVLWVWCVVGVVCMTVEKWEEREERREFKCSSKNSEEITVYLRRGGGGGGEEEKIRKRKRWRWRGQGG